MEWNTSVLFLSSRRNCIYFNRCQKGQASKQKMKRIADKEGKRGRSVEKKVKDIWKQECSILVYRHLIDIKSSLVCVRVCVCVAKLRHMYSMHTSVDCFTLKHTQALACIQTQQRMENGDIDFFSSLSWVRFRCLHVIMSFWNELKILHCAMVSFFRFNSIDQFGLSSLSLALSASRDAISSLLSKRVVMSCSTESRYIILL